MNVDYVLGIGGFNLENVEKELNMTLKCVCVLCCVCVRVYIVSVCMDYVLGIG